MLEFMVAVLFIWLLFKATGLVFGLTWGLIKVLAIILLIVALPVLTACLIFAGGIILLMPFGLLLLVFGLLAMSS